MCSNYRSLYTLRDILVAIILGSVFPVSIVAAAAVPEQEQSAAPQPDLADARTKSRQLPAPAKLPRMEPQVLAKGCVIIIDRAPGIMHLLAYQDLKRRANTHANETAALGYGCSPLAR